MIEKILSSGQAGAATAALEIAIKLGLAYGGWCGEGVTVADKYRLERLPDASYGSVTEKAVGASQGSLYFMEGEVASLRLETTKKTALRLTKPLLIQNLARESGFSASRRIAVWIVENRIKILHVDGEDDGQLAHAGADRVAKILEATFFLAMMETGITAPLQSVVAQARIPRREIPPATLPAALNHLERSLSLKDRAIIANMTAGELVSLHFTLGDYINSHFDLFTANSGLLTDCRRWSAIRDLAPKDAAAVIIRALWERLRATCRIRVVK